MRHEFGGTEQSFVADLSGNRLAGQTGTVWTARTGGTQITDLQTPAGITQSVITSSTVASPKMTEGIT